MEYFRLICRRSGCAWKKIHLSGLEATLEGVSIVGSAASIESSPYDRSFFELLERISIIESLAKGRNKSFKIRDLNEKEISEIKAVKAFGESCYSKNKDYQIAKSNGIALHDTWREACLSAASELVERHHILSSWFGHSKPERIAIPSFLKLDFLSSHYEINLYKLGESKISDIEQNLTTVMLYLRPKTEHKNSVPLLYSFCSGVSLELAVLGAEKELLQRVGFLWGEELPTKIGFSPTAHFHGEFYLNTDNHYIIESWIMGDFYREGTDKKSSQISIQFVDISSETSSKYYVAKAISNETIDLYFGNYNEGDYKGLSKLQKYHPIP